MDEILKKGIRMSKNSIIRVFPFKLTSVPNLFMLDLRYLTRGLNDESRGFLGSNMEVCTCKVSVTRISTNNFNPGSITSPNGCNDYENSK